MILRKHVFFGAKRVLDRTSMKLDMSLILNISS